MENTEELTDSEQVREEGTEEPAELPQSSEAIEDDVLSTEDIESMSVPETSAQQIAKIEFEHHEEDLLVNETLEDTFIDDLLSREDSENEEEEEGEDKNEPPVPEPEIEKTRSAPDEPPKPTENEGIQLSIYNKEQMDLLHELDVENEKLYKRNCQLQSIIAEYFSKKTDHHPKLDDDISVEEQYQKYMDLIADVKEQQQHYSDLYQQQTEQLRLQSSEKLKQVEHELRAFAALKHEAVMMTAPTKVGNQKALAKLEQLQADELKQEEKLACVRHRNIKLKNEISQYETALRSKRKLVDGLLLMDFEQLKTENQTFKDKLEERSEELLNLKRKVARSVQGISHVKEKIHFMQLENKAKHTELAQIETLLALKREKLTRTRQARDRLRTDNLKLQQRCGLRGNTALLQDFEEKVDASENLQQRLEMLKKQHAELNLKCAGVKQKIEHSRPEQQ